MARIKCNSVGASAALLSPRPFMYLSEFLEWSGMSRAWFYSQKKKGLIFPDKKGERVVITIEEANRWASTVSLRCDISSVGAE